VSPAKRVRTTVRDPDDPRSDDLVRRNFTADGPDKLWVADLTLVPIGETPPVEDSIKDAFSRRIVGWHISTTRSQPSRPGAPAHVALAPIR